MTRHSNGQFAPRQFTAPLVRIARKSPPHVKGAKTKAANQRAKVRAVADVLAAEVRAAKYARSTLGILERHNGVGGDWLGVFL